MTSVYRIDLATNAPQVAASVQGALNRINSALGSQANAVQSIGGAQANGLTALLTQYQQVAIRLGQTTSAIASQVQADIRRIQATGGGALAGPEGKPINVGRQVSTLVRGAAGEIEEISRLATTADPSLRSQIQRSKDLMLRELGTYGASLFAGVTDDIRGTLGASANRVTGVQGLGPSGYTPGNLERTGSDSRAARQARVRAEAVERRARAAGGVVLGERAAAEAAERAARADERSARAATTTARAKAVSAATDNRRAAAGGGGRGAPPPGAGFDAFFGAGPGGAGGGLFTSQRLLRQGVSFAGYALSAAAIGGSVAVISDTVSETLSAYEALSDLDIALDLDDGRTLQFNDRLINQLTEVSVLAGENVSTAMQTSARGIRAFAREANEAGRALAGLEVAEQANQLAVIADKGLGDATGDLIASGRGFSIAAEGLAQVNDAVAVAKQGLGGDPNQIAQGLASSAQIAAEAGFSLQETASIVSAVSATTDATGRAAATSLTRLLSTLGGNTGQSVIASVNSQLAPEEQINTTGSLRDQLFGLAAVYDDLSEAQRGLINNQIGGRTSARELVAIFDNLEGIYRANAEAANEAGQGQEEFDRKLNTIAGTFRIIGGELTAIQRGLVDAGIFDAIGVTLELLRPGLTVLREVLETYNALPREIRSVVAITGEYLLLQRLLGPVLARNAALAAATATASSLEAGTFAAAAPGRAARVGRLFGSPIATATAATRLPQSFTDARAVGASAVGGIPSARGLAAGAGAFLTSVGGLATVTLLAATAVREFKEAVDGARLVIEQGRAIGAAESSDPQALLAQAEAAQSAATQIRAAGERIFGISGRVAGSEPAAQGLDEYERALRRAARDIQEARESAASQPTAADVFDFGEQGGVEGGLDLLTQRGRDAEAQLVALSEAFSRLDADAGSLRLTTDQVTELSVDAADQGRARLVELFSSIDLSRVREAGQANVSFDLRQREQVINGALPDPASSAAGLFGGVLNSNVRTRRSDSLLALTPFGRDFTQEAADPAARALLEALEGGSDEVNFDEIRNRIRERYEQSGGQGLAAGEITDLSRELVQGIVSDLEGIEEVPTAVENLLVGELSKVITAAQSREIGGRDAEALVEEVLSGASSIVELAEGTLEKYERLAELGSTDEIDAGLTVVRAKLAELEASLAEKRSNGEVTDAELEAVEQQIRDAEAQAVELAVLRIERDLELANLAAEASGDTRASAELGRRLSALQAELAQIQASSAYEPGSSREQGLLSQIQALTRQRRDAQIQEQGELELSRLPLDDNVSRSTTELQVAEDLLANTLPGQAEYAERVEAVSRAQVNLATAIGDAARTSFLAANNPDNELAAAVANYVQAALAVQAATPNSQAAFEAQSAMIDALLTLSTYNRGAASSLLQQYRNLAASQAAAAAALTYTQAELSVSPELQRFSRYRQEQAREKVLSQIPDLEQFNVDFDRTLATPLVPQPVRDRPGQPPDDDDDGPTAEELAQEALRLRQAQRRAGLVPGSPLQAARIELANAEDALGTAKSGTEDYYTALASVRQAQYDLAEAQAAFRDNQALLATDLTDPLAVAETELRALRERAARNIARGADESVRASDDLDIARAVQAAEQTYFDQNLSLLRRNLDLGRTTRAAYIAELNQLANELRAIEGRTFQQQELLDQIDLAIKSAAETATGQFNLGDIDVPTPFEARRAVESQIGVFTAVGAGGSTVYNDTSITINGGDIEEVRRVILELLGRTTQVSPTLTARRN